MRRVRVGIIIALGIVIVACASPPPDTQPSAAPPVVDFGEIWSAGEITVEQLEDEHGLSDGMARVTFESEWTAGESAGLVYPKEFIGSDSGETVEMDFMWDDGGNIPAGVYDVRIDIDGRPGEGWLRNIDISGDKTLLVTVNFNAAKLDLPLDEIEKVVAFPAGTYDRYKDLEKLDTDSRDDAISWHDAENKGIYAVIPATTLDLQVWHADGSIEWLAGYDVPGNSVLSQL